MTEFPKTPHIVWFGDKLKDDKLLTEAQKKALLYDTVVVQEKVDGNCIGVSYDAHGNPHLVHREGTVEKTDKKFQKLFTWYERHEDELFDLLTDRYELFGEWLYWQHTVPYTQLPSYFLVHDMFDRTERRFMSTRRIAERLEQTTLHHNPRLFEGRTTMSGLLKLLDRTSRYANCQQEGIYVRQDTDEFNVIRAKIVNPKFHKALEAGRWEEQFTRNGVAEYSEYL